MTVFLATHTHKIDKKGRVSVPASFRALLSQQSFQGIVVFRSLSFAAIEGFGMDRIEKLSAQIDRLDSFSQDRDDLTASIFADAQPLPFDSEGRILLPENLISYGQLQETVAFVGRGATFQLWNPENFKDHQEKARQRLLKQHPSLPPLPFGEAVS
ncbi:MAG: division/cell wall cluster transcriptional repressor MraZ [Holosporales bacterium]|jgi:MraZ protein